MTTMTICTHLSALICYSKSVITHNLVLDALTWIFVIFSISFYFIATDPMKLEEHLIFFLDIAHLSFHWNKLLLTFFNGDKILLQIIAILLYLIKIPYSSKFYCCLSFIFLFFFFCYRKLRYYSKCMLQWCMHKKELMHGHNIFLG